MTERTDLTGERFGRLKVLSLASVGPPRWLCQCDCGQTHTATAGNLVNGSTQSCGCLYRETRGLATTTHGLSKRPEYQVYREMIAKCYDPRHPSFWHMSGRGVTVCDRWMEPDGQGITNFFEDMGPRPTKKHRLWLRDFPGEGFTPENTIWSKSADTPHVRKVGLYEWRGEKHNLSHWARLLGFSRQTLSYRLSNGWSIDEAFSTPAFAPGKGDDQ